MREPSLKHIPLPKIQESSFRSPTTNSKRSYKELKAHVEQEGILQTLLVRKQEGYQVVDGNRRLAVAQELGMEEIPCAIIECTDKEAVALSIALNRLKGQVEPDKTIKIFRDLKEKGFSDEEVREVFPEKMHEQIQRLLDLVKIMDKEPMETPDNSLEEEDKADLESHATTGPHHKQLRFEKEEHREEFTEIVEEEKKEGEKVGFTVLRLLRSLDSSKTRTHVKVKEE